MSAAAVMAQPILDRSFRLDLVKATVTLLVVFHHTAITYGAIGGWFYVERPPDGSLSSLLLVFFCTVNQAWFMGLFFLIAGRFTPGAIDRKGAMGFLRDRAVRLGIPWLVFGLILGPATIALARTARGDAAAHTLVRLWRHLVFEPGPLWFAQALLIFTVAAVVCRRVWPAARARAMAFPANAVLLSAALTVGAVAFCLRLVWPVGAAVWHLQLGYFASYALLFAVGCLAADRGWFEKLPEAQVRLWRRVTWVALPTLLPLAFLATRFPVLHAPATGGFSVPALMYALWEPFVAWGILLSVLAWAARPARPPSPLAQQLARRAYGIFVIHPVVVVGVALAWRAVAAPALLKFAVTGAVSCVLCFWIVGLLLRLPIVRRVL